MGFKRSAAHCIIPCPVRRTTDNADVGNRAGADGTDEASPFLDQTSSFGLQSDHEAGHVVEEDDWYPARNGVSEPE